MSTFLLANENDVKEALAKADRPTKANPLKDHFPPWIFDKAPPEPLPLDVNDHMDTVFRRAGETAVSVFNTVRAIQDGIMQEDDTVRRSYRFSEKVHLRMIATSMATWGEHSQKRPRDWLPVAGGTLLEWAIMLRYRRKLFRKQFGHARRLLKELILMFVEGTYAMNPDTKMMEQTKNWDWVDGVELPEDLEELIDYLVNDAESVYRHKQSRYKLRREMDSLINFIFNLECARTYMEEFVDVSTLRGKAKKMALAAQGPIMKSTPFFDKEVFEALYDLTRVRSFISIALLFTDYLLHRRLTSMAAGGPCVRSATTRKPSSTRGPTSSRSSISTSMTRVTSTPSGPIQRRPLKLPLNRALLHLLSHLQTQMCLCPLSRRLPPSLPSGLLFLPHPLVLPRIKALSRLVTSATQMQLPWTWTLRTPRRPGMICTPSCRNSTLRVSTSFLS